MRFVHLADMHFDAPFTVLASQKKLGTTRRLEQREVFKDAINYIKEEKIPFLFISGDLYEQNYIRESTIEYINDLFKMIPDTKIFISPGNHDPLIKNSPYNTFNWNENVYIFNSTIKRYEFEEVDIYGFGFEDFYCTNSGVENIEIINKEKSNILITHGSLDASQTLEMQYNPINSKKIKEIGFDYIALGHIHKSSYKNTDSIAYPGSIIAFGFDELGEHGILDVELIKNKLKINFIKLDKRIFEEKELNINLINSEEELIEIINKLNLNENIMYKLILIGIKKIKININEIIKLINQKNILKIKDLSKPDYDLDKLANQNNLKGIFVKEMIKKMDSGLYDKTEVEKAIEIGLDSL